MIIKILDCETGEKSIMIFTDEHADYLEFYLEGKFKISNKDIFHEGSRVSIDKFNCEMLVGLLQKWLDTNDKFSKENNN